MKSENNMNNMEIMKYFTIRFANAFGGKIFLFLVDFDILYIASSFDVIVFSRYNSEDKANQSRIK